MLALTSGLAAAVLREGLRHHVPRHARARPARPQAREVPAGHARRDGRARLRLRGRSASLPSLVVPILSAARWPGSAGCPPASAVATPGLSLAMPGTAGGSSPAAPGGRARAGVGGRGGGLPARRRGPPPPRGRHLGLRPHRPDARGWSTRRPRSRSRCGASSPSSTARPRISRSTSTRSRDTSSSRSRTGARIAPVVRAAPLRAASCRVLRRTAFRVRWLQAGSLAPLPALHGPRARPAPAGVAVAER